jgi:hypothetical protein
MARCSGHSATAKRRGLGRRRERTFHPERTDSHGNPSLRRRAHSLQSFLVPNAKLERYMTAIVDTFGDGQKQVKEALGLIQRNAPPTVEAQPRRLLALRRYLRMGGKQVVAQWTWTPEEAAEKMKSGPVRQLMQLAEAVQLRFAEHNHGFSLAISPLRSLERQVEKWHGNATVRDAGERLHKEMIAELEKPAYPDTVEPAALATFRTKLRTARVQPEPSSAAPGTSDHGQFAAVDFVVMRGGTPIATTSTAQIAPIWEKQGWDKKLATAINKTLKGPLQHPYEPWHWSMF